MQKASISVILSSKHQMKIQPRGTTGPQNHRGEGDDRHHWGEGPVQVLSHVCMHMYNEWHAMEKTTRPWTVVSLKGTMGTMGRDPQISENVFFGDPRGHSSGS